MIEGLITYAPIVPLNVLWGIAAVLGVLLAFAAWRGLRGWFLRGLAVALLLAGLANPSYRQEDRTPLADIVFVVVDETTSQTLGARKDQMAESLPELRTTLEKFGDALEVVEVTVRDTPDDLEARGSLVLAALDTAASEVSADRIAGAIIVSDGQAHDLSGLKFAAPVHLLQTGDLRDWDRRLVLETAPAFGIVGESVAFTLRVEDTGPAPAMGRLVEIIATIDGQDEQRFEIVLGESVTLEMSLEHAGINLLDIRTAEVSREITHRNNHAVMSINGVRDRLRVLLVSGEPYAGERTWRNLLKADASVDLVHFTILRSPDKQDGVPVTELSLIAFPTRELFMEKIDSFDLIIFDRYRRWGILPDLYLENTARYLRDGGAILIATGPAFAGVESLARSPLRAVLPALPTGRVFSEGYLPKVSDLGRRHPVTSVLGVDTTSDWGRWFRQIDLKFRSGHVLMDGAQGKPLLTLDRVGEGRIALLASDQAWLWSRGFEGGGPQRELLRRVAHWLMKEPQLEEDVLRATARGQHIVIERRSMDEIVPDLTITDPAGTVISRAMEQIATGNWSAEMDVEENGIYRISEGDLQAVVSVGPAAPREYAQPIGVSDAMLEAMKNTGGGLAVLATSGLPDVRRTRAGRVAKGANWIGLPKREAYVVRDIRLTPLAPGWLILLLFALASLSAWRFEGR